MIWPKGNRRYIPGPRSSETKWSLNNIVVVGSVIALLDDDGNFVNCWHVSMFDRLVPGDLDVWAR